MIMTQEQFKELIRNQQGELNAVLMYQRLAKVVKTDKERETFLKLAKEGKSVTFISSEIDEMLRTCSRLVVMRDLKQVGELSGDDLNQTKIMETIAGGEK